MSTPDVDFHAGGPMILRTVLPPGPSPPILLTSIFSMVMRGHAAKAAPLWPRP